ncbi:MAG: poly-gamma-glutamate synthase PgsB [Planctomycetota bacterium]|nr:MAG: poly-gamma-glutamate synthase PgsB [Planctomycetota bacterium]REK46724.1 MAG: poly-gamma-glutamate synthase PgsB [Planctomycetota bacterium]
MTGTTVLIATTLLLAAGGLAEAQLHRRRLRKIPIRIHVNGTRGKSSVTRLIAAGLREGGIRTCAKTTGTLPRMILPDGSEYPVFRPARANVIEQLRIVDTAIDFNAEALVMECMALIPHLQWLSESKMVQATHGVITNAREDHLDVMGPSEDDVARALAGMVPRGGKLYTAEQRHLAAFQDAANDRKTELIHIGDDEAAAVTPLDLAGFAYVEHPDNLATALKVCADLGVDKATALRGMWNATPDPGAMTAHELDFFGRRIFFVNGFAANDPESTEQVWRIALERYPDVDRRVAIFNCRGDRPDRSKQLGEAIASWPEADRYLLIGTGTYIFARAATKCGVNPMKFDFAEGHRVEEIFESVVAAAGESTLVMGMANIGGPGLEVVRYFANRSTMRKPL